MRRDRKSRTRDRRRRIPRRDNNRRRPGATNRKHEPASGSERAQQLGWPHETRPDMGRLDPELAGRFGFGQVQRIGALPAYRSEEATVVWVRPDLDWGALLEAQANSAPISDPW